MSILKSKQKNPDVTQGKGSLIQTERPPQCVAKTYRTLLHCYLEKGNLCLEEVKKFGRSYGHLLEVMLEHAQIEEGPAIKLFFLFLVFVFFFSCGG